MSWRPQCRLEPNVKPFVKVSVAGDVGVLAKEGSVAFEIGGLVDVKLQLG